MSSSLLFLEILADKSLVTPKLAQNELKLKSGSTASQKNLQANRQTERERGRQTGFRAGLRAGREPKSRRGLADIHLILLLAESIFCCCMEIKLENKKQNLGELLF